MNFANLGTKIAAIKYQVIAYVIVLAIIGGLGYGCKHFHAKSVELELSLKQANERITKLEEERDKIKKSGEITEKSILAILKGERAIDSSTDKIAVAVQDKIDKVKSQYTKIRVNKPKKVVIASDDKGKTPSVDVVEKVAEVAVVTTYENQISEARIDGLWAVYCSHIEPGTDAGCKKQFDATTKKPNQIDTTIQGTTNHEETVR